MGTGMSTPPITSFPVAPQTRPSEDYTQGNDGQNGFLAWCSTTFFYTFDGLCATSRASECDSLCGKQPSSNQDANRRLIFTRHTNASETFCKSHYCHSPLPIVSGAKVAHFLVTHTR